MDQFTLPGRTLPGHTGATAKRVPEPPASRSDSSGGPPEREAEEVRISQRQGSASRTLRSAAQEATTALLRAADQVRRSLADVAETRGITSQQFNVLRILRDAGGKPLRASDIGDRLIEQTPGTTRLLDRLEAAGLIRRERSSDDRRVVLSWITRTGSALLVELEPIAASIDEAKMHAFTEKELNDLVQLLIRLQQSHAATGPE